MNRIKKVFSNRKGRFGAFVALAIMPLMTGCALPQVLPGGFFASDSIANLILLPVRSLLGSISLFFVNTI